MKTTLLLKDFVGGVSEMKIKNIFKKKPITEVRMKVVEVHHIDPGKQYVICMPGSSLKEINQLKELFNKTMQLSPHTLFINKEIKVYEVKDGISRSSGSIRKQSK